MLIDDTKQDLYQEEKHAQYMCIALRGLEDLEFVTRNTLDVFSFYATGTTFYQIHNTLEAMQPHSVMRSVAEYYIYKADCL